jgi:hypothetical protein
MRDTLLKAMVEIKLLLEENQKLKQEAKELRSKIYWEGKYGR